MIVIRFVMIMMRMLVPLPDRVLVCMVVVAYRARRVSVSAGGAVLVPPEVSGAGGGGGESRTVPTGAGFRVDWCAPYAIAAAATRPSQAPNPAAEANAPRLGG